MILILPFLAFPFALIAFGILAWVRERIFRRPFTSVWPPIFRLWGSGTIAMFVGIGAFHTFGNHVGTILLVWMGVWMLFGSIALIGQKERRAREARYRELLEASAKSSGRPRDSQDSE